MTFAHHKHIDVSKKIDIFENFQRKSNFEIFSVFKLINSTENYFWFEKFNWSCCLSWCQINKMRNTCLGTIRNERTSYNWFTFSFGIVLFCLNFVFRLRKLRLSNTEIQKKKKKKELNGNEDQKLTEHRTSFISTQNKQTTRKKNILSLNSFLNETLLMFNYVYILAHETTPGKKNNKKDEQSTWWLRLFVNVMGYLSSVVDVVVVFVHCLVFCFKFCRLQVDM